MSNETAEVIAVVPAAGHGSRMGLKTPKQFLTLYGSTVLECTVSRLLAVSAVQHVVLVVGADDQLPTTLTGDARLSITIGGETRSQSVFNGLTFLSEQLRFNGSVLVHDAARPCVRVTDIDDLISEVSTSDDGGLLAIPVHDTLKKSDAAQNVVSTVDREHMWRAVTPQLFKNPLLQTALADANQQGLSVTDEASAMEMGGYCPRLVRSSQDNIKITEAGDLSLAQTILESQERE